MAVHIWFQLTTQFIDPERMKGCSSSSNVNKCWIYTKLSVNACSFSWGKDWQQLHDLRLKAFADNQVVLRHISMSQTRPGNSYRYTAWNKVWNCTEGQTKIFCKSNSASCHSRWILLAMADKRTVLLSASTRLGKDADTIFSTVVIATSSLRSAKKLQI